MTFTKDMSDLTKVECRTLTKAKCNTWKKSNV